MSFCLRRWFPGKRLGLLQTTSIDISFLSTLPSWKLWGGKNLKNIDRACVAYTSTSVVASTSDKCHKLAVIQPVYKVGPVAKPYVPAVYKLEETVSLVEAITGWEVHHQRVEAVRDVHSQFFFGKGKIAELKSDVRGLGEKVTGVLINTPKLTPLQHRTLEDVFKRDVFDRFGIVLQIFKERAKTREAKLQVEMAEIPYTYVRLNNERRSRKEGSDGMSLETRKFRMNKRLKQLEEELGKIRNKRKSLRESRTKRCPMSVVAIVGYTNAGKTTLIKALTQDESMMPKDMLFATLDSTLHAGRLPCGLPVLYVDTIGFISDLPVELVESFASTLEDSIAADVLVHVIDGSHPQAYAQRANVLKVLDRLKLKPDLMDNLINVVNKVDKGLPAGSEDPSWQEGDILASATCNTGLTEVMMKIQEEVLRATKQTYWRIEVPASGPQLSWLYSSDASIGQVTAVSGEEDRLAVWVLFSEATLKKFIVKFSGDKITMKQRTH